MIVCPVCEHQQPSGFECQNCGKDLSGPLGALGPPPIATAPMPELEQTVLPQAGDVGAGGLSDLEATARQAVDVGAVQVVQDLDLARAPAVEVPPERINDMMQDRVADDGVRTAAPSGAVMCRYCRNVQETGNVCNNCGMRLPRAAVVAAPVVVGAALRCRACGSPGIVGERCKECGRPVGGSE